MAGTAASYPVSTPAYVFAGNYGASQLMMRVRNAKAAFPYVKMATVVSPASTYMIMDSGNFQAYPTEATAPGASYNYLPGMGALGANGSGLTERYKDDFQNGRHFGGLNMTFADGHAKWLKAETVFNEAKKMTDEGWSIGMVNTGSNNTRSMRLPSAWNPFVDNS